MEPVLTPYDLVAYPGFPYSQTHPDRLATLAHLYGMTPASVECCRVLELGCGNGANLIPMAMQLPASQFLGIDLSSTAVANGQKQISDLGLSNIQLCRADLMDFSPVESSFDYIIAHGLFSWVPPAVQEKILTIVQLSLALQGVAYISYNAMPGGHLRLMIREMMQFHGRQTESSEEKAAQGTALIQYLANAPIKPNLYASFLNEEWEKRLSKRDPHVLIHDELSQYNQNFYFCDFMTLASAHQLQFLAEADFSDMQPANFHPQAGHLLLELGDDIIAREQYLDFLKGRRFRQTLLCHSSIPIHREISLDRISHLMAASSAKPSISCPSLENDAPLQFCGPHQSSITTAHPFVKSAMSYLAEQWPRRIAFFELCDKATAMMTVAGLPPDSSSLEDQTALAQILLLCYGAGLLELHTWAPRMTLSPGAKPMTSPLTRLQTARGEKVTTLCHETIEIEGSLGKKLVQLLDGTRDRSQILRDLTSAILEGEIEWIENGEAIHDSARVQDSLVSALDTQLIRLARLGLLQV